MAQTISRTADFTNTIKVKQLLKLQMLVQKLTKLIPRSLKRWHEKLKGSMVQIK